jgi:hypothetical protein
MSGNAIQDGISGAAYQYVTRTVFELAMLYRAERISGSGAIE